MLVYVQIIKDIILIQMVIVLMDNKILKVEFKLIIVLNNIDMDNNVLIYVHMVQHYNQHNV